MLSHHRTLIFVFVVGRLFFVHCLQPGHANLGGCLKFFADLDFEEIMSKKASATLTGRMLRNQLYYEFAVFYHPKPSLECYREESKPDLSNKRVVRTIGKTEKKNTVVCFFALRVSFCGNWGWRGGSKIHALPFFSFF